MTERGERTYTATEAAQLIDCSLSTVLKHAARLLGPRLRPGAHCRLTLTQVEQIRQVVDTHPRELPVPTSFS